MTKISEIFQGFTKFRRFNFTGFRNSSLESVDDKIIGLMRILLAVSALVITFIDPTSPDRFVETTYAILIGYCIYSAVLYLFSWRSDISFPNQYVHWIDVAWYSLLIALSNGTSSIFFFFFFFSILIAAFRSGFDAGLRVTIVSALLFSLIGYATAPHDLEFELNRFLIRPIYLMMLGYMISYWGGQEIKFKRHLLLLKDVSRLSNPRFGVNRTLSEIINRLRAFYDAESCVLITFDSTGETFNWRESNRENANRELPTEQTKAAAPLVKLPGDLAFFHRNSRFWKFFGQNTYAYNVLTAVKAEITEYSVAAISDLLETETFLTVPVMRSEEMFGRLYLLSPKHCFERSEIEFISHLIEQVLRAVENVELLNRLASEAADRQREKISRDLHDSTIQPYVGLKLGLEALEIKYATGAKIGEEIEKLLKLTDTTISELRGYVSRLKSEEGEIEGNVLIRAVKQQAVKFKEFYDINIRVEAADGFQINDRLAAEAFQIISEGLSNIKRHTKAKNGTIFIFHDQEKLYLEIENDGSEEVPNFTPKSIAGRAKSLGGATRIERHAEQTKVSVEIPL